MLLRHVPTNTHPPVSDDNYFMEDEYSVCKDSNFEEEKEREFLARAGICQEGETCNFDCSQWKNNYNGDCNNDIRSDEGYPLMRELCPAFCQRCDNKICTACPKYTTSKRGANIGDGSCKKIDDGKTCFTDESCTSGVCKGSCCSSSYKNKDCIKCGSDGQCEQCGESWLDSDQCCTSTDAPYSGCSVPDCTAINNPIACKPQVCTARDEPYKGCIIPDCTAVNSPFAGCKPQACTAKDTPYKGCVETKAWCTESSDCGAGQVCSGESNVCPKWCPLEWESDPTSFSKGCTDMDGETSTVTINSEERLRCSKGCKCCKFQEESDSTASQTENQVVILKTVLRGVSASTFNGDPMLISAFKATVASLLVDVSLSDIYDVEAQDTLSDRRRRLDSVPSCTVNYKIRATSQVVADAASKKAEALTSVEFTKMLRENMNDLNVKSVPSSSIYAEILPKETDSLGEKKFSGSQSSDSTTISSSTSTNSKEEEAGGEGGAGLAIAMVFIFVVLPSIAAGLAYWKRDYLREKWTEYRKTKSSPVKTSTASLEMMAVNPTFAGKLGGDKAGHESVEIFPENDDMPKLYALLKQLTMAAWINKFVLHGIHTTEMLLSDVDSDVLIELGMRSQQRRRLLSKMEELRGSQEVVDSNYELTDREKHANEEVARGGWQRRFSVVAGREYFENSLTGDTQFERPETFEGTSKEDTEETETDVTGGEAEKHLRGNANSGDSSEAPPSLQEQLKHARLPEDLLSKIEAEFDGDIAAVSDDWIAAQTLPRLKVRRLEALRAKARGVLWYHGKTGDYDFWMNASTDEYQYMPPETEGSYIMPAPRNYFEDCKADLASHDEAEKKKKIDDSVAATAAAKWRRARAKIKTIQRIKALKNIQAK